MSSGSFHVSGIPYAKLRTISYSRLLAGDRPMIAELLAACSHDGFFYLDLLGPESQAMLEQIERLFVLAKEIHDLPTVEKLDYEMEKFGPLKIGGYKPAGKHTGILEGKGDGFENFLIPRNGIFDLDRRNDYRWPSIVDAERPLLHNSMSVLHEIGVKLLSYVSEALGMMGDRKLECWHRGDMRSTTALAMLRYLPNCISGDKIGHMAHTDVGSLTILFSFTNGLQVFQPHSNVWANVRPRAGHAVVNVGDSLSFLSNGVLRSSLHRVVPHIDNQYRSRYSIAYFLRPEEDVQFRDAEGRLWKSQEWHVFKYAIFRAPVSEQLASSVLTGKKGFVGHWEPSQSVIVDGADGTPS